MKSIDKKEVVIWLMTLVIVLIICCLLSLCGGNSSERWLRDIFILCGDFSNGALLDNCNRLCRRPRLFAL